MSGFFEKLVGLIEPDRSSDSSLKSTSINKPEDMLNSASLLKYLTAAVKLNRGAIRNNLSSFDKIIWLSEFPDACHLIDWQDDKQELGQAHWLELKRPCTQPKWPLPDEDLCCWLKTEELENPSLEDGPVLQELITISDSHQKHLGDLNDTDEIRRKFSVYIEKWLAWAEKEKVNQAERILYEKIFAVCQMLENEDEIYELVLGFGLLLWGHPSDVDSSTDHEPEKSSPIYRHLFTISASVEKDSNDGGISVGFPVSGGFIHYEDEMLRENQRLQPCDQERLLSELKFFDQIDPGNTKLPEPFEKFSFPNISQLGKLIKLWITAHPSATYSSDFCPPGIEQAAVNPHVAFSPALILRKRDLRGMTRFIEKAAIQLSQRPNSYSPALLAMVGESIVGDEPKKIDNEKSLTDVEEPRIYFPLPASAEQLAVGEKLDNDNGLMIVGPPGTGKSTLIANVICHLLASGKRILVTSEAARPLQVLREMLPARLRNLCVSYLGDSDRSQACLKDSITAIRSEFSNWDRNNNVYLDAIKKLDQQLTELVERENETKNCLIDLQNRAVSSLSSEIDYAGTSGMLAEELERARHNHEWILAGCGQDCGFEIVKPDPRYTDTLFNQFLSEVIFLLKFDRQILVPSSDILAMTILEPETVKLKCLELQQAKAEIIVFDPAYDVVFEQLIKMDISTIEDLQQDIVKIIETVPKGFFRDNYTSGKWNEIAAKCCFDSSVSWSELLQYSESELDSIDELLVEINGDGDGVVDFAPVAVDGEKIPVNYENMLNVAERLYDYFKSYIKLPFADRLSDEEVEHNCASLKLVTVDNARLNRLEGRKTARKWLARVIVNLRLELLEQKWKLFGVFPEKGGYVTRYKWFASVVRKIKELRTRAHSFKEKFTAVCVKQDFLFSEIAILPEIEILLTSVNKHKYLDVLEEEYKSLVDTICGGIGGSHKDFILDQILTALQDENGQGYVDAVKLWNKRGDIVCTLNDLAGGFPGLDVAVIGLAETIMGRSDCYEANSNHCSDEIAKFSLQDAWIWAWRRQWLLEENLQSNLAQLQIELYEIKKKSAEIMAQISADLAWIKCVEGLDEDFHNNLNSWKNSIAHLPKDKKAKKYRHIFNGAMKSLRKCSPAVPGWVMPLQFAVEWFSPADFAADSTSLQDRPFDVVIMDEASQSRVEALILFMLARKVIVIGDQKQNMPSGVGLGENIIREMINNNLPENFPKRYMLRYDYCFLEIYANFFRFEEVNLREHYRCAPEIIGFCNENFYTGNDESLYPLRQPDIDWVRPAIKTVYVPEGCMTVGRDRKINIPEAEAVAEAITLCCSQENYRKVADGSLKSMGVISLQGGEQAELIMHKLQNKVIPSAEEILQRRLNSGISRVFQGDQRDIIFLSLVASRKTADGTANRLSAQTTKEAQRIYNVAVSRAREQLWLFHSVLLNELSPRDLRYKLLEYCLRKEGKFIDQKTESEGMPVAVHSTARRGRLQTLSEIARYRELADSEKRCFDNFPIDLFADIPFESWFELDVFLDLVDLGYNVIPQVPVFGSVHDYCIDLVVLLNSGRVAVECDGLKCHNYNSSEEVFRRDLERQIALERCGWLFCRLRASVYYLDPEQSIAELDKELVKKCDSEIYLEKSGIESKAIIEGVGVSSGGTEHRQLFSSSSENIVGEVQLSEEHKNENEDKCEVIPQIVCENETSETKLNKSKSMKIKDEGCLNQEKIIENNAEEPVIGKAEAETKMPFSEYEDEKITEALLDALRNDPDPEVRQTIALALIESRKGVINNDD